MSSSQPAGLPMVKRIPARGIGSRSLFAGTAIRPSALAVITVSCVWLFMVLLANPVGEFPLNDDWSYSRAVQNLIEHGRLELTGFTSMPLIAQVFWGALFCLPFGFSFTALRLSTLALGFVGILATYELLIEVKAARTIALFATMVVALNPLYFHLALTFMTDVPFFTVSMLAFLFLLRALRTENRVDLLAGYGLAGAAILIRQLGVIIPLSFVVAYFSKNGFGRKTFQNALVPTILSVALLFAFPIILRRTIGLPALYDRSFEPILESAPMGLLQVPLILAGRLFVEWIYLGLFLLPLLILLTLNAWQAFSAHSRRLFVFIGSGLFTIIIGVLVGQDRTMPLVGNVLFDVGLGPVLLRDTYLLRLPHWSSAPPAFWLMVTAAGVLGGLLLIQHLLATVARIIKPPNLSGEIDKPQIIFLLLACILYAVLIGIAGFLDRYFIFLLPLLMIVILAARDSAHLHVHVLPFSVAIVLVILYGLFALGGTHDYLAWNRARWQALNDLMERDHVSYTNIDGGFEFNGWYAYDPKYRQHPPQSWWWVEKDDYMISFGPMLGYAEMRRYPFEQWIPPRQGNILVLQRVAEATNGE